MKLLTRVAERAKMRQKQRGKGVREQVVEHVAKFSLASLVGGMGSFFSNYFAALLLGPMVWGTWQGAKLVLQYGVNLHLGVQNGMHREIPILRGKKESGQQATIIDVSFTFSFVIALIVSLGILFSTFIITMGPELRISLRFIAIMVFLQYIYSFYGYLFRAYSEFDIVSRVALIDGLSNGFSIGLIFPFGLLGFLGGQVLRLLITTAYSWWKSSYTINWRWNSRVLKSLILIGFPIMLMLFANIIFTTIDRLLILKFLDARSLGFYSLGKLVFAPLLMVFTASSSVMYPRFAEQYGKTGDPRSLKRYITVPMEVLSSAMAVLVGAIYIALPLLTKVFLPKYVDGVPAARILMFGLFFYAISGMAGNMLLTINKQVLRLWILLGSALLNFGFSFVALKLGYGIEGVAAGTSIAYFLFFLTISVMAMKYTHAPPKETGKLLTHVLGVIFYIGIIAVLLLTFFSIDVRSSHVVVRIIINELVLVACSSYIIYKLIQRHRIVELIRGRWPF